MYQSIKLRVKEMIKKLFTIAGLEIHRTLNNRTSDRTPESWGKDGLGKKHQRLTPYATYSPWLNDMEFQQTYKHMSTHTLVDLYRCYELWTLARQTANIDGCVLEVGVWRGGTGALLAMAVKNLPNKKVYLADTFAGVVKAGINDTCYKGGEHADTSLEIVNALIVGMSLNNVQLLQGVFPEETQHKIVENIALLHCDVDVYSSAKDIVEWSLPRLSPGSILVFDDYGFSGCEGVTTLCDELKERKELRFIYNLNGHAVFVNVGTVK
ncbi:MAG TPA: TylF/MycF/NovP-related O-methyltransferase [Nitrospira sp.]|nr:TylF/MycF/NovP-related O-methyltransferase [Nitrospira sp.]